jgi:hypothetical protein
METFCNPVFRLECCWRFFYGKIITVCDAFFYELLFDKNLEGDDVWKLPVFDKLSAMETEFDTYQITPYEVEDGVLQCKKCGSHRVFSTSKQVRSGDESTSVFAKCVVCNCSWAQ